MWEPLKRFLIGEPKATAQAPHERLSNPVALAVLSSDALSSVAYATEEILLVLVLVGAAALAWTSAIAAAIALLYVIVTVSYRQTIQEYPTGGGAYSVSKDNLGVRAAQVAGASLLIDYVLTVSVSVAAGVAAITSAFPDLYEHRVILSVITVVAIAVVNLRGVRESGRVFAVPTYLFIVSLLGLIVVGMTRILYGEAPLASPPAPPPGVPEAAVAVVTPFLILRAFSSGCVALTGVEAISNGILVFRKPEAENAKQTMAWMAAIMLTFFIGITFLARQYEILPREGETVVSQLARTIVGTGPFYYVIQASTALILLLAANTSFADFPRLSSLLAADRFLPRQFVNRGDRLVFSNGIIILALLASLLLVGFGGDTHALIPLYAVGVFISFTLSQAGMVRHHFHLREPGWRRGALINGTGALTTGIVLTVIAGTKFMHGAWMVVIAIPIMVGMFSAIHHHYRQVAEQLRIKHFAVPDKVTHVALLLVSDVHMGILNALNYARAISPDVEAVYVNVDEEATKQMRLRWALWSGGVPLVILDSPYRSVVQPLIEYVDKIQAERKVDFVTIILPEFVPARWWHTLLHNQTALWIRANFLFRKGTVVINVRFHLDK